MGLIRFVCDACLLLLFVILRSVAGVLRVVLGLLVLAARKPDARSGRCDGA